MSEVKQIEVRPILRNCHNCEYSARIRPRLSEPSCLYCEVRYQEVELPRLRAILCRFYKSRNKVC